MNEVMNAILSRRSIRKYTDKPVPEEILGELVDAALHAPSGMCGKTWNFTVVCGNDAIKKLCTAISEALGRSGYDMYGPAALIIPSNLKENRFGKEDNACALQNIFIAAQSYGVSSVWINQLQGICDSPVIRPVLREFGIPDDHVVYGIAALGYADPSQPAPVYKNAGKVRYVR